MIDIDAEFYDSVKLLERTRRVEDKEASRNLISETGAA